MLVKEMREVFNSDWSRVHGETKMWCPCIHSTQTNHNPSVYALFRFQNLHTPPNFKVQRHHPMASGLSAATVWKPFRHINGGGSRDLLPKSVFLPPNGRFQLLQQGPVPKRRRGGFTVCFVVQDDKQIGVSEQQGEGTKLMELRNHQEQILKSNNRSGGAALERQARKESERFTYLVAAVMSSLGITSMAVMAVYYRFYWQMEGGEVPLVEMFGTFALSVGAAVGMEFWARWAHRALWHASLWHMHESHHRAREGAFELNDVFAIMNAVPAISLLAYGLCFGAGLGITVFGMAYMFVHDGLVHRRIPVGPIANVPYFRRVAAAHQLHHSDKFEGVPYGLFLGPKELEEVGGLPELEKEINRRAKSYKKGL